MGKDPRGAGKPDAGRPGSALAGRFRRSIELAQAEARQAEREREARLADARRERGRLLADLTAFGKTVGHFDVTATADVVVLRYEKRTLRFEATGEADGVTVRGDGLEHACRLFLHGTLGKWTLGVSRPGLQEDQRVFFDAGLSHLIEQVFELAPASDAVPEPPGTGSETPAAQPSGGGRTL